MENALLKMQNDRIIKNSKQHKEEILENITWKKIFLEADNNNIRIVKSIAEDEPRSDVSVEYKNGSWFKNGKLSNYQEIIKSVFLNDWNWAKNNDETLKLIVEFEESKSKK